MTCPCCADPVSDFPVNDTIGVCPSCARSLVKEGRRVRVATAEDLRGLTAGQITELRQARPAAWRNDVRARHARIVGAK